jgi:hypothetical protein
MEISWNYRVKNELLQRFKEDGSNLRTIKREGKLASSHLTYNTLFKTEIKRKLKETKKREKRSKHMLDGCKERKKYWNL